MKKYYVNIVLGKAPVQVEMEKETMHFAMIRKKEWNDKQSSHRVKKTKIFNTFEEAKQALIDVNIARVKKAEAEFQRTKSMLNKIRELKEE